MVLSKVDIHQTSESTYVVTLDDSSYVASITITTLIPSRRINGDAEASAMMPALRSISTTIKGMLGLPLSGIAKTAIGPGAAGAE